MSHLLWWSYLNFHQCHLLRQVQTQTRLIRTWNWNITFMEYNCCAWMVCSFLFLLLHPTCVTSTFAKLRKQVIVEKTLKNYDVFHKCKNIWIMQFLWEKMFKSDYGKINCDALPSFWTNSNVSLKWKQWKNQEMGHIPWLVTLSGVKGHVGVLGWD